MDRDFYTVPEAAVLLRVSKNTAYEAIKSGQIHAIRIGKKRIIVPAKGLEKLIDGLKKSSFGLE